MPASYSFGLIIHYQDINYLSCWELDAPALVKDSELSDWPEVHRQAFEDLGTFLAGIEYPAGSPCRGAFENPFRCLGELPDF